jgi:hypothetical protein
VEIDMNIDKVKELINSKIDAIRLSRNMSIEALEEVYYDIEAYEEEPEVEQCKDCGNGFINPRRK